MDTLRAERDRRVEAAGATKEERSCQSPSSARIVCALTVVGVVCVSVCLFVCLLRSHGAPLALWISSCQEPCRARLCVCLSACLSASFAWAPLSLGIPSCQEPCRARLSVCLLVCLLRSQGHLSRWASPTLSGSSACLSVWLSACVSVRSELLNESSVHCCMLLSYVIHVCAQSKTKKNMQYNQLIKQ